MKDNAEIGSRTLSLSLLRPLLLCSCCLLLFYLCWCRRLRRRVVIIIIPSMETVNKNKKKSQRHNIAKTLYCCLLFSSRMLLLCCRSCCCCYLKHTHTFDGLTRLYMVSSWISNDEIHFGESTIENSMIRFDGSEKEMDFQEQISLDSSRQRKKRNDWFFLCSQSSCLGYNVKETISVCSPYGSHHNHCHCSWWLLKEARVWELFR